MANHNQQKIATLNQKIKDTQALINEWRDKLLVADEPTQKKKAEQEIVRLEKLSEKYEAEIRDLSLIKSKSWQIILTLLLALVTYITINYLPPNEHGNILKDVFKKDRAENARDFLNDTRKKIAELQEAFEAYCFFPSNTEAVPKGLTQALYDLRMIYDGRGTTVQKIKEFTPILKKYHEYLAESTFEISSQPDLNETQIDSICHESKNYYKQVRVKLDQTYEAISQ